MAQDIHELSNAIQNSFRANAFGPDGGNVVTAILSLADSIHKLGLSNASTSMGALELLSKEIHDGAKEIKEGLFAIAEAIDNHRET